MSQLEKCKLSRYPMTREKKKRKLRIKRWKRGDDGVDLHLLEDVSEKVDKRTELSEVKSLLYRCIKESFKYHICIKISRPINISGCCQLPIVLTTCVERWFKLDECCPICKNNGGREKRFLLMEVKDFNMIISKNEPEQAALSCLSLELR